ncbi:cAMP-regulated phosphoprotein 21 [Trametes pubescens]|uniref:cAMP-regulated phosphoprotein 21 n=1 Tax=Trametes pubescens TaxID=154538 RepID=A0A1M2VTG2_TRAPU|nr:cAMP-regulated phosphoprotein 21 [Trametes pubescens]
MGALSLQDAPPFSMSPSSSYPSHDDVSSPSYPSAASDAPARVSPPLDSNGSPSALLDAEPDAQILEALRGKDRIYVLKLGEQMEALIKDRRARIDLTPSTSYQRLLVHRCSAYYRLSPEADAATKNIIVYYRTESRIPARRICELIPPEESAQPTIQIMRRPRGRQYSQPGSTAGEDADTSDVDASEAGSIGSRSHAPGAAGKRFKTIEEREAAYNEARSRIFMGFEDKDKEKEKDMSANSSTFSLVSGSGSTSGGRGSSIGDLDDSASSVPTESEWSGPVTRDKRDSRKGAGSTTSSRSIRSSGPSFTNGSSSSRNSRATSPSFTYPTLYDPATAPPYEQSQYGSMPPPTGYVSPYGYPTYTPGQPFMGPYYYPPYGYPPPPTHHSEPATPGGVEAMYPQPTPSQQPAYTPPYMWSNPPPAGQPPVHPQHLHHGQPGAVPTHPDIHSQTHPMPPMQSAPQYPPYTPNAPVYGYGMPAYYPQPYQQGVPMAPPPSITGPVYHHNPVPEPMGANGNHSNGIDFSRTSSRSSNGHGSMNSKRGGARGRGSWTYGPGVSTGGYTFNSPSAMNGIGGNDAYGPRLSSNVRRASGTSSSGGSAGARTPADETASTAPVLQPNDFPPLSSGPSNRQPVVGGAWTNASTSRVMMPGPQGTVPQGTALVHYPASQQSSPQIPASTGRFDEQELSFERSLSKNADLFNPKGGPRSASGGPTNGRTKGQGEGCLAGLSDKLGALGMEDCESRVGEVAGEDSYFPAVIAGEAATGVPAGEPAAASS